MDVCEGQLCMANTDGESSKANVSQGEGRDGSQGEGLDHKHHCIILYSNLCYNQPIINYMYNYSPVI